MKKKIVYFDMDGVLADYDGKASYKENPELEAKGFFTDLAPIKGGVEAFIKLSEHYDCYILTTAPWSHPDAMSEKRLWVEKHLGEYGFKRLMTSHRKDLHIGDYLIDDRTLNGAGEFQGEHIHFGSPDFPDWDAVVKYLMPVKSFSKIDMFNFAEHCMLELLTTKIEGSNIGEVSFKDISRIRKILKKFTDNGKKK